MTTFVFPMAGRSSRFFASGYTRPKYELPLWGATVFDHVVRSFSEYWGRARFLFVCTSREAASFVLGRCERMGVANAEVVVLDAHTRGQAETVDLGLENATASPDERLVIFNIDTVRPQFRMPRLSPGSIGYIETFLGEGDSWSFVRTSPQGKVVEVREKHRVSPLCCTGLYIFNEIGTFRRLFAIARAAPASDWEAGELFVAPLYEIAIRQGEWVDHGVVESSKVLLSGTPKQYEALLRDPTPLVDSTRTYGGPTQ